MFFCFFRHTVFTHTRYIHWLTAFDSLILLQQSASGLGIDQNLQRHRAVSLRQHGFLVILCLFSVISPFGCDQLHTYYVNNHKYVMYMTDRQTDKQISQKWSIFAGELHPTICVEWAGDHLVLGLYKSIQFDENTRENDIHFRSQWPLTFRPRHLKTHYFISAHVAP